MFLLAVAFYKEGWIISWPSLRKLQDTQIMPCRVVSTCGLHFTSTPTRFRAHRIHPKFENSETFTQPMTLIP
jgi:hypothetical protein